MKTSKRLAARALLSLAALTTTGHTLAQNALGCAWPLTISPSMPSNEPSEGCNGLRMTSRMSSTFTRKSTASSVSSQQ